MKIKMMKLAVVFAAMMGSLLLPPGRPRAAVGGDGVRSLPPSPTTSKEAVSREEQRGGGLATPPKVGAEIRDTTQKLVRFHKLLVQCFAAQKAESRTEEH